MDYILRAYGHAWLREYAEWRDLGPDDIHKGIERVHRQGGIVGIAHPFRMGSPICTGCHWEYAISDWNDIDYIEVWHSLFPPIRNHNAPTFAMWTDLLNQGCRIPASSGRDWHNSKPNDDPAAASFLGIDEELAAVDMEQAAVDAIRKGRVSLSMGPLLLCSIQISGETYGLGQTVPVSGKELSGSASVIIELDSNVRKGSWTMPKQTLRVELVSNKGVIGECSLSADDTAISCLIDTKGLLWLRAQLYGTFHECSTMIAFTNPVYFGKFTE